jgi:HlyD family secretion protein
MAIRRKRRWLLISLVVIALGAVGYLWLQGTGENNSSRKYRMVKVDRGNLSATVTATGTINPVVTVLVGSQISGTIKALYADFNSRVKEGQVVAQIDPAIFEAQVAQAKANVLKAQAGLANAQAAVQSAQANLDKAEVAVLDTKRTLDRNVQLAERKVVAQQALDTAQANYDSALAQRDALKAQLAVSKAQVESEKANVENTKAALKVTETNLRYTTIRSPVTGTVISRNVDVGQTVAASLQAPTLFTIAKDLTEMQVDTNFSEADIGRIEQGQEATFTVDAYPEITFRGKVSEIRNAPQTVQNVVTYDVVIKVANPELKLKPGMTANVSIVVAHQENVLRVPNAVLRFRPEEAAMEIPEKAKKETSGAQASSRGKARTGPATGSATGSAPAGSQGRPGRVWTLTTEGKLVSVPVGLGITDGSFSQIVSGDLKEGTEVIVEQVAKGNEQNRGTASPFGIRK